jgi:MYXO-CTERM domain-containing protein
MLSLLLALQAALPVYFEANVGQTSKEVLARGRIAAQLVEARADRLEIDGARIDFAGGRAREVRFEGALDARVSVVRFGHEPLNIPSHQRAVLVEVWPGIDLVLTSRDGRFAFDLAVAPGADPARAKLTFGGTLQLDADSGALLVRDARGVLRLSRPVAFQGERVEAGFRVRGQTVHFELGGYDRTRSLLIDPVVEYASYTRGESPPVVRSQGEFLYITQRLQPTQPSDPEMYVAKLDPRVLGAASLLWSTSYSGNNPSEGQGAVVFVNALDVAASERMLVCGVQSGGGPRGVPFADTDDSAAAMPRLGVGFAAVIAPGGGAIEHVSSFSDSGITHCKFDLAGDTFYSTGRSDVGPPTPTTPIAGMTGWGYLVQTDPNDDPAVAGDDLLFSSRLGVQSTLGRRIAVDPSGNVVLGLNTSNQTGPDVDMWVGPSSFQTRNDELAICKFATALGANALLGCTYLGGTSGDGPIADLKTDAAGNIYVYAVSGSADFPTTGPTPIVSGPIVARLTPDLSTLDAIYFFPANGFAQPASIELLDDGSISVVDNYFGGPSWPFTSCALTEQNLGSNYAVLDSALNNVVFGSRLPGLFGSTQGALPRGRVAIAGSIFAGNIFNEYVNGYESTGSGYGMMVLSVEGRCLDLQLTGRSSSTIVELGNEVSLSFETINLGPDTADDVTVDIMLPPLVELIETSAACSSIAGGVQCAFGSLANTASASISLSLIATSTGVALVNASAGTSNNDLDPANNAVMFPLNVTPHPGPCGPVSIYGVCDADLLRICVDRNTQTEQLVETECAAMNQRCVPAEGRNAAHCVDQPLADAGALDTGADAGVADGETAPDAVFADAASASPDASVVQPVPDAGLVVEPEERGCDCRASGGSSEASLWLLLVLALTYFTGHIFRSRAL